ncbi:YopX family protein [Prevotella sp. tc2-28]|uniref:YopX family protein n=1 Tax=Prevotella sp. tc2-28 TaxID=1761888 RepID=UPI0015A35105|nr:YopX family protein [Prevotella sp. tc2-28]
MEWKFRGWDATGNKGWVYGDLVHNQKITKTGLEPRVMVGGYEVVPESVGLWTGRKDSNGKDIFVGDILRDAWDLVNEVIWDDDAAGVYLYYKDIYSTFMDKEYEHMEIIGNNFLNKELLDNE